MKKKYEKPVLKQVFFTEDVVLSSGVEWRDEWNTLADEAQDVWNDFSGEK